MRQPFTGVIAMTVIQLRLLKTFFEIATKIVENLFEIVDFPEQFIDKDYSNAANKFPLQIRTRVRRWDKTPIQQTKAKMA